MATTISSGQTVSVTSSSTSTYVVDGGGTLVLSNASASVNSATVFAGGVIDLLKGTVSNTSVSGGELYVTGGNTVSGATIVTGGGSVEFATSGGVLNGSLTFGSGANALVLDKVISQAGLNSATLSGFGADDVIEIAGGYTSEALSYGNNGSSLTLTVSGGTQTFNFNASQQNAFDLLASTPISTVASGKTSGTELLYGQNVTVSSGATLYVYASGSATGTTVSSGGALNDSGVASNTTLVSGGVLDLTAAAATLSGSLTFSGGANDLVVSAVANGGAGDQAVISGFGVSDLIDITAISASGASASFSVSGGDEVVTVANGGMSESFVFSGTTAYTSNTLTLTSDANGDAELQLTNGGSTVISVTSSTASGAYNVSAPDTLLVLGGGSVSAAMIQSGAFLTVSGGLDAGSIISAGASATVSLGSASDDQIFGSAVVLGGGSVTSETVESGGALTTSGTDSATTVSAGIDVGGATVSVGQENVVGGSATGDKIYGALNVSSASVSNETVESGGSATFGAGAVDSGMVVSVGGQLLVAATTGSATLTGDQIYGTVSTVSGYVANFTNETVENGGLLFLQNSNNATGTIVVSGGELLLSGHESAVNTTLSGGGLLELDSPKATLSGSLTFGGGGNELEFAVATDAGDGDTAVISGFSATDKIEITSGAYAFSALSLSESVSSGDTVATITSGSTAVETISFAGTALSGSLALVSDNNGGSILEIGSTGSGTMDVTTATSSGAYTISANETLLVLNGGSVTAPTIEGGGFLTISGGDDSGAIVQSGALETVSTGSAAGDQIAGSAVVDGGAVTDETVAGGGKLTLDGGVTNNVLLDGSASLDVASSGAALDGSITFANGHNTLYAPDGAAISATISGYSGDDKIQIVGMSASGAVLSFTSNSDGTETVTVTGGGQTDTFNFANNAVYNAGTMSLAADGPNVDLVKDTTPTVAFSTLDNLSTNQSSYTVDGTVNLSVDPYASGSEVSVYEGATVVGTATVQSDGYWQANLSGLANGADQLTATDLDAAENTGSSQSLTLNVNTAAAAFSAGNLVVSISGDGNGSGDYTDNQASPMTLEQITTSGAIVSQLVMPEEDDGANYAVSSEYGSSSEGTLELSADGHSLVIGGYGVDDVTYNTGGATVYGNAAEAQSTSEKGAGFTPVARVIVDVNASGNVDSSTGLFNIYNTNNPRSVATVDGSTFYTSGQGDKNANGITNQGVFSATDGASAATNDIYNASDTRSLEIYNGNLYASMDTKGVATGIYSLGSLSGLSSNETLQPVIPGAVTLTAADANNVNGADVGQTVNLSPENFFFADDTTLYVADSGNPKNGGLGDGGLQKWTLDDKTQAWQLDYTLSAGLSLVANTAGAASLGDSGLYGLTGEVVGNQVELYATTEALNDLGATSVVAITDTLNATSETGETFSSVLTASPDENIRGIAFAPTPCYCTGVRILTDRGEVAVEELRVGDLAVTASGDVRPIVWIGHRKLDLSRHPNPASVEPVRVAANAFGEGLPCRDLWVSPGHNIAFEDTLIPASALVNGQSVVQVARKEVEYWHIELDAHDVLFADGLPAESYLDTGNRTGFANGGAFVEAHPDFEPKHWAETCLPLMTDGPVVARARARLLQRLAEQGFEITPEADAHILVDGRRIDPVFASETRLGFVLPAGSREVMLRSNTFVPTHVRPDSADLRTLGLCVGRLQIDGAVVGLADAAFCAEGWSDAEAFEETFLHRWTDGAAHLPAGARLVMVDLGGAGSYRRNAKALSAISAA